MMEINIGNLEFYNEIEIGNLQLDVKNVYPELEEVTVQSRSEEQVVKPKTKYGFSEITVKPMEVLLKDIEIKENGIYEIPIGFDGYGKIIVNIKGGSKGLTSEQIEALNAMRIYFESEDLIIEYDDSILDIDFDIENNNLVIENSIIDLEFNINDKELEAIY